jgi:hypothetical protein
MTTTSTGSRGQHGVGRLDLDGVAQRMLPVFVTVSPVREVPGAGG